MLEIYLNIAEWGPGVFGAEAAARHHFNKPASRLTERESALLAAALPNPILRDAGDPGTRTARKASVIQARMRAAGPVANCAMTGRQRSAVSGGAREAKSPSGWQTTVKKRAGADPGL
jgi:monofunctional biosynthetic peptidoglycan transglycosylase